MAINLMDLVKSAISSSGVADQIGSAAGLDKSKTNSAIDAAIPVLLSGLMKKASTPSGASELSNIFKKQDAEPSILDNLGSLVSGGASSKLLGMGSSLLPMLLGLASEHRFGADEAFGNRRQGRFGIARILGTYRHGCCRQASQVCWWI